MNYIEIINDGEIDLNGLFLLGASTKDDQKDKIGFFGSGNKYAIAVLLREKISFKIFSGIKEISIKTKSTKLHNINFDQIYINEEPTSFTTRMGPDWKLWYVLREFISNAKDEGGYELKIIDDIFGIDGNNDIFGVEGKTKIFIEIDDKMQKVIDNLEDYILTEKSEENFIETLDTLFGQVSIYEKRKPMFNIFRKGISIIGDNKMESLYWYDFEKIKITEDRIYKYHWQYSERIASAFTVTNNEELIYNLIYNWQNHMEKDLHFEYVDDKFSNAWYEILKDKRIYPMSYSQYFGSNEDKIYAVILPDSLAEKLAIQFPNLYIIGYNKQKYEIVELTKEQENLIDEAKKQLKAIGYNIDYDMKFVKILNNEIMAWFDKEIKIVYICVQFLEDIEIIKRTLLEEFFHTLGYSDGSRKFVDFLINELILLNEDKNKVVKKIEEFLITLK